MDTRKPAKYLNVIKSQLETVYSCSISVSGTPLKVFSYIQIKEEENPQQFLKKKKKKQKPRKDENILSERIHTMDTQQRVV
jgi:hypothetical protein